MPEWLRRQTWNLLDFTRAGSNLLSTKLILFLFLLVNFCPHWDLALNLELPTNPPIPLPLEPGLKVSLVSQLCFYSFNILIFLPPVGSKRSDQKSNLLFALRIQALIWSICLSLFFISLLGCLQRTPYRHHWPFIHLYNSCWRKKKMYDLSQMSFTT